MKTKPTIGSHLEHTYYNATELAIAVIELAESCGMPVDDETRKVIASCECDDDERANGPDVDALAALDDCENEAIDWLNDNCALPFAYWSHSGEAGAFGLWPDIDGAREDCPTFADGADAEFATYVGEWVHVNDHGNVTLWCRNLRGDNREIWSVV